MAVPLSCCSAKRINAQLPAGRRHHHDEADDNAAGCCRSFLVTILKHHPQLTGVLFDQPQVIDKAKGLWAKDSFYSAVADRVELVGGTFFDAGMAFPAVKDLG